jgi:hypothetical protein
MNAPKYKCPSCKVPIFSFWQKFRATRDKPLICPKCGTSSYPNISLLWTLFETASLFILIPSGLIAVGWFGPLIGIPPLVILLIAALSAKDILSPLKIMQSESKNQKK